MLNVVEDVRRDLINEVKELNDEQLNKKPAPEEWSINQVLIHLYKSEMLTLTTLKELITEAKDQKIEDKPVELTVDRSKKRKAPDYLKPTDESMEKQAVLEQLETSRKELASFVENYPNQNSLHEKTLEHPVFGEMSIAQWIDCVGYHEKRHLIQIKEIKKTLSIS
ncbi:DinB family protein [Metabacillus arenae]|uniref:DinB family protein n=1 Tax=Metabacillus arenae TaxID=2771434 RepID=A0A926RYC2_9BACI|nr:DinB family protein [Metabacillus arenae]MBD1381575.1 DinB family protein [Metabacillus arenae]